MLWVGRMLLRSCDSRDYLVWLAGGVLPTTNNWFIVYICRYPDKPYNSLVYSLPALRSHKIPYN